MQLLGVSLISYLNHMDLLVIIGRERTRFPWLLAPHDGTLSALESSWHAWHVIVTTINHQIPSVPTASLILDLSIPHLWSISPTFVVTRAVCTHKPLLLCHRTLSPTLHMLYIWIKPSRAMDQLLFKLTHCSME